LSGGKKNQSSRNKQSGNAPQNFHQNSACRSTGKACRNRILSPAAANFEEVNLGFTEQLALLEADRCLQCKEPPVHQGLPGGRQHPADLSTSSPREKIADAAQSLMCDNALPAITGPRLARRNLNVKAACVRSAKGLPVGIGYLERYVADWARTHGDQLSSSKPSPTGKTIAIRWLRPGWFDRSR